jgi:XTP/dITP diphosphohydrolase
MTLRFITTNTGKLAEAKSILKEYGVEISSLNLKIDEIRSESCARVAEASAQTAYSKLGVPLFVEDAGLFVKALGGFPGAYSAWAFDRIGNAGLLRLLKGARDRRARFVSAIAYADSKGVRVFTGECEGSVPPKGRGRGGFGYDPVFIPRGSRKTFAQDLALKARVSHRRRALDRFAKWYSSYAREGNRKP